MKLLRLKKLSDCENHIAEIKATFEVQGVVILPTETVYGIGARYDHQSAVEKVYSIKNRPLNKPLSYHFDTIDSVYAFAGSGLLSEERALFEKWKKLPITFIYFDQNRGKKIGVRIPSHPIAKEIIRVAGGPLLTPSANFSGDKPPKDFPQISEKLLEQVDLAVDSGPTTCQIESTVVDLNKGNPKILRQGAAKI